MIEGLFVFLLPHQGAGAYDSGVTRTQFRGQNFNLVLKDGKQMRFQTLAQGFKNVVAGGRGTTKQKDGFGRKMMHGIGQALSQILPGFFKHFQGNLIPFYSCLINHLRRQLVKGLIGQEAVAGIIIRQQFKGGTLHARSRAVGLQVAMRPTTTNTTTGDQRGVSAFTGKAIVAVNQITIDHHATAYPVPRVYITKFFMPLAPPYTISPIAAALASLVNATYLYSGNSARINSTKCTIPLNDKLGAYSIVPL